MIRSGDGDIHKITSKTGTGRHCNFILQFWLLSCVHIFQYKYLVIHSFHNSAHSIEKDLEHSDMGDAYVFVFVRNGAILAYSSDANRI